MSETVSVLASGPAFSFLLYENVRTSYDQEGFLIGQFIETQKKSITDNDVPSIHVEKTIIVNSIVPCPKLNYFYNGAGIVDGPKITTFLGPLTNKVVGWYKFHRGSSSNWRISLREKIVHKQLANSFDVPPELFLFCLLSLSPTINYSTHNLKQTFFRYYDPIYQQIPMHIVNVSDPNTSYKASLPSSETFKSIFKGLKMDITKMQGLESITKIHNALQNHTDKVIKDLAVSEEKMKKLESETAELREKLRMKKEKDLLRSQGDIIENGVVEDDDEELVSPTSKTIAEKEKKGIRVKGRGRATTKGQRNVPTKVSPGPKDKSRTRSPAKNNNLSMIKNS